MPANHNLNDSTQSVDANEKAAATREAVLNFQPKYINLIVQEAIIIGAGAAAILLQLAEPGVGQGVNQHSNFTYRVTDRLRTTMTFVYCMVYGTPEERRTITDMVTRVHTQVNGTLDEGRNKGQRYSALDPELQLWVAATLYATAIQTYQRIFGVIEDDEVHENIYREYAILATTLQVPPDMWPATREAFWAYWDRKIETLEVTQHAKEAGGDLLSLRHAPFYLRVFLPSVRIVTSELLPERMRREFGLTLHPRTYRVVEFMTKAMYKPLPLKLRSYPATMYMKDMRKRLAQHRKVFEKAA